MYQDVTVDKIIGDKIKKANEEEKKKHVSSGKLSASMLGQPLQWQVLKLIGVPSKEFDEYLLRKFKRGNDIEDWLAGEMPGIIERQKEISYLDCVGFIDAMVDTKDYGFKCGIIPHEIKSVSNAKFKRIIKDKKPDISHILQACLYALAVDSEHFAIDYVATDDLRVETYVLDTKEYSNIVEKRIKEVDDALKAGIIPDFEAREKWQSMPDYQNYPEFGDFDSAQSMKLLYDGYRPQYNKLMEFKNGKK